MWWGRYNHSASGFNFGELENHNLAATDTAPPLAAHSSLRAQLSAALHAAWEHPRWDRPRRPRQQ
jgi:hypothetical protein